jgi:hypothetical protein
VLGCGVGLHHRLLGQVSPGRFFFLSFLFCLLSFSVLYLLFEFNTVCK